ncbi:MAG: TonB-dependent receptor [Terracidiphilus sp.]|jgi:hypothetical protein
MRQAKYMFYLLPLFLVLVCVGAFAQSSDVTGIITDQTGAAVADASVVLTDPGTGSAHSTTSGATGLYEIGGLTPANYNLRVSAKGFEAYVQNGIVVNVSSTVRVDAKLTVGAASSTVTVTADALVVQADSNVISTLITDNDIDHIATENRNIVALAALGLGTSNTLGANNSVDSVGASFAISFNGLNQAHNIYLIDGGESYDRGSGGKMAIMPSQDSIAEFQTLASNYPPDYGTSSGGTVSMVLKSGTQKFHGTLYEENRTTDYNASQTAAEGGPGPAETHFNIFGGNVSGPLFVPHVYNSNKQKTFFFWNEEWRKVIAPAATTTAKTLNSADIPTAGTNLIYTAPLFATGNQLKVPALAQSASPTSKFALLNAQCANTAILPAGSCAVLPVYGMAATPGKPLLGIPSSMFDANGVLYLESGIIPAPNVTTGKNAGYNIASSPTPLDVRDDVVRIDHNFNDKWRLMGHYIHDTVAANAVGALDGWAGHNYSTIQSVFTNPAYASVIKLTGTISPNLLLEASLFYDGNKIDIALNPIATRPAAYATNFTPVTTAFPLGRTVWPGAAWGAPYKTQEDTNTSPYSNASEDYLPRLDLSYTTGKHALKIGFDWNRYIKNQQIGGDTQGNYTFGSETGDGMMDMLAGLSDNYTQQQAAPRLHFVANTPSAYAQDNWHVTSNLSVQAGIRYDAYPHAYERQNQLSYFDPTQYVPDPAMAPGGADWTCATCGNGSTILQTANGVQTINGAPFYMNGMVIAGQNGVPRGLVKNDYFTIQPRLGFSDDLFGNGKTVLRGGAGIFYERVQLNDLLDISNAPINNSLSLNDAIESSPANNWNTGAVVSSANLPVFVNGGTTISPSYKAPGVAQFSLGVQRELLPSVIWVVQYVGNVTWHQSTQRAINTDPLTTPMAVRADTGDSSNNYCTQYNTPPVTTPVTPPTCLAGDLTNSSTYGGQSLGEYRTYPGFAGISREETSTNGGYNSLQSGLRIQDRWGLSGEIDYTYSHEIDIQSTDLNSNPQGGLSNPFNAKYDKGSGVLDRRHILSINYVYKLPFFAHSTGIVRALAGGWQLAGTVVDESGTPQTLTLGVGWDSVGLNGGYTNRPSLMGKVTYPKTRTEWFNNSVSPLTDSGCVSTALWCAPTPVWAGGANQGFGTSGKDSVVGPGLVNFTTSMYKVFQFTDRISFRLNIESFNTFNHAEYDGVSTAYGPSWDNINKVNDIGNFGALTASGAVQPRNLQLGGRLIF